MQGEPLPGASIYVKGDTRNGVTADANGRFTLAVPAETKAIIVSFVGMEQQEVVLLDRTDEYSVRLQSSTTIDEVVVTGIVTKWKDTFIPFKTGQDLVYMEGTSYNQNVVFAILEDEGGARSVLATNLTDNQYVQENYYEDIQAENFNVAEHFAFHSQYPYMFYAYGNKVYTYQLGTGITTDISLPAGEEITMLKIDLWKWLMPSSIPEDKVAEQHYVLVGSYNPATGGDNGGILRRYRLNNSTNSLELVNEWSGFAKIVDVCYRERF